MSDNAATATVLFVSVVGVVAVIIATRGWSVFARTCGIAFCVAASFAVAAARELWHAKVLDAALTISFMIGLNSLILGFGFSMLLFRHKAASGER